MPDPQGDSLLTDLCTICHINAPKYRCPRCSTRTCSLPCSRRHKLWSQCSGVRDPAAYLRRNELATPSAFDRDFNFITGIERSLERAERDADNRGISLDRVREDEADADGSRKRRRPNEGGFVKGEAGFLRGAQNGGVRVIRAPKGMSRNKENTSKWNPKHKCLNWTVEWIGVDGEKRLRNCLESSTIAEDYDRVYPQPKQDRDRKQKDEQHKAPTPHAPEPKQEPDVSELISGDPHVHEPPISETTEPSQLVTPVGQEEQGQLEPENTPDVQPEQQLSNSPSTNEITSHRNVYFYLHRPRTTTKQPVIIPLAPSMTLTSALRDRVVLEFPTIYVLSDSPDTIRTQGENPKFLLEEEYLRTQNPTEEEISEATTVEADAGIYDLPQLGTADLGGVDENKVLEVLKKDLFEPVPDTMATQ